VKMRERYYRFKDSSTDTQIRPNGRMVAAAGIPISRDIVALTANEVPPFPNAPIRDSPAGCVRSYRATRFPDVVSAGC
jgi:hypothetical protein